MSRKTIIPNKVSFIGSGWMYIFGVTIQPMTDAKLKYFPTDFHPSLAGCQTLVLSLVSLHPQKAPSKKPEKERQSFYMGSSQQA